MSTFHNLTIKNIIKETKNAVSISFDIPRTLKNNFTFLAGQYITLKTTLNGDEVRRAYSLCSSPSTGEIKVAVKAIENGLFSKYATTALAIGDVLEVSEPEGKFTLQLEAHKNYIAFAAGSGITPIMSMIKVVLETEETATFTLIYGNKTIEDTIFFNDLNILQQQYPEHFKLHYVFSRERQESSLFGRIEKDQVNYFIKNLYKHVAFDNAFLCGPETMITMVSGALEENGMSSSQIAFELFTASVNKDTVGDIKEGNSELTIVLDDEQTTFSMPQTDTILAASLRQKLDAPYSCQGGVCSSCIAKVVEGKAIMTKNQILTDAELEEGFILTCQAHPITAKLVVDFDDV